MERPDISSASTEIQAYIEYLEKRLGILSKGDAELSNERGSEPLPGEPETSISVITISVSGWAKRSYRHLYGRQHRGGMGVFDLEVQSPDFPGALGITDENRTVLLLTNRARAFRYPLHQIEPSPPRSRGSMPFERLGLEPGETIVTILADQARGYVAMLGASGKVRLLRHHLFGEHMKPGTSLFNPAEFGPLTAACWTPGDAEIFIVTEKGMGIRFPERVISPQGDQGIRISGDDKAIGLTSTHEEGNVFLIGADGRGTIRSMQGFAANKSAGGSGKIAFKNNHVIGCAAIEPMDELFLISRLGKIIRFPADEVPITDGPVQGVICMSLRADEVTTFTRNPQD